MQHLSLDTTVHEYFVKNQDYVWKRIKHLLASKIGEKLKGKTQGKGIKRNKIEQKTEQYLYRYLKQLANNSTLFDAQQSLSNEEIRQKYQKKKEQANKLLKKVEKQQQILQRIQKQNTDLFQSIEVLRKENKKIINKHKSMEAEFEKKVSELCQHLETSIHHKHLMQENSQKNILQNKITKLLTKIRALQNRIDKISRENIELGEKIQREVHQKTCLSAYASELKAQLQLLEKSHAVSISTQVAESRQKTELAYREYQERIRKLEQELAITEKVGLRLNKFLQMQILSRYLANSKESQSSAVIANESWQIEEQQQKISALENSKKRKSFRNASNPQLLIHKPEQIQEEINTNHSNFENSIWETFSQQNNYSSRVVESTVNVGQISIQNQRQLMRVKEELVSNRQQLELMREYNKKLQQKISYRDLQIKELKKQKQQTQNEKVELEQKIVQDYRKIQQLSTDIEQERKQFQQQLFDKYTLHEKQLSDYKQEKQSEMAILQSQIANLKNDLEIQELLYLNSIAKIPTLQITISTLHSQILQKSQQLQQKQLLITQLKCSLSQKDTALEQKQVFMMEYANMINSHYTASFSLYTHTLTENSILNQEIISLKLQQKTCDALLQKNHTKIQSLNKKINQLTSQKSALLCKLTTFLKVPSSDKICAETQTLQNKCEYCEEKYEQIRFLEETVRNRMETEENERALKIESESKINKQTITRHIVEFCSHGLSDRKKKQNLETLAQILEMVPTDKKVIQDYIRRNEALTRKKELSDPQQQSIQNKLFKFLKE